MSGNLRDTWEDTSGDRSVKGKKYSQPKHDRGVQSKQSTVMVKCLAGAFTCFGPHIPIWLYTFLFFFFVSI